MDKEKIVSEMKLKLGKTQLSDKTLSTYFDDNQPSDGSEPDDAFWNRHKKILESLQGQFDHDVASEVRKQVEDYKKTNTSHDADNGSSDSNQKGDDDDSLKALKELAQTVSELKLKLEQKDKAALQEDFRKRITEAFKKKIEDSTSVYFDSAYLENIMLKHGEYDTTKSVDDEVAGIVTQYEKMFSDNHRKGGSPLFGAGGGGSEKDSKKMLDDFFSEKAKQGKFPKNE